MTTAHMLHILIHQWHFAATHHWHFRHPWNLALRYLERIDHARPGGRAFNKTLLHFLERHHYGPRTWKRWTQA